MRPLLAPTSLLFRRFCFSRSQTCSGAASEAFCHRLRGLRRYSDTWQESSYAGRCYSSLSSLQEDLDAALERHALSTSHVQRELEEELVNKYGLPVASLSSRVSVRETAKLQADSRFAGVNPVRLFHQWLESPGSISTLPLMTAKAILDQAADLLERLKGPLVKVRLPESGEDPKVVLVGDTHGQLLDVLHILHENGPPSPETLYVFNGDIADRGSQAVEIWLLLLSFMLRLPNRVYILRGNHENRLLNERSASMGGGFTEECLRKYNQDVHERFQRLFMLLPVFAVIEDEIFVVHAGLSRFKGVTLEMLQRMPYRCHFPLPPSPDSEESQLPDLGLTKEQIMLFDAQWADPCNMLGVSYSARGKLCASFGPDITHDFLETNNLSLCVRSHQVPKKGRGFDLTHHAQVLTVFSASNYVGSGNKGAVAILRRSSEAPPSPNRLKVPQLQNLWVEVVEHDLLRSDSHWLDSASATAKVVQRISQVQVPNGESLASEATNHALAMLCLYREKLWSACCSLDTAGSGQLPKLKLLELLETTCGKLCWDELLKHFGLNIGLKVSYTELFDTVQVRWTYLGTSQIQALSHAMLEAELHLDGFVALFDVNRDGTVTHHEFQSALKRLLPGVSAAELHQIRHCLGQQTDGTKPISIGDVIDLLLLFAPSVAAKDPRMQEVMPKITSSIEAWAKKRAVLGVHGALLRFFKEFDTNGDGLLSIAQLTEGLLSLQAVADEPFLDAKQATALAEALDTNGSNSVSFLELCRELLKPVQSNRGAAALQAAVEEFSSATQCSCTALMFVHREALVHGCELLDPQGSGSIAAADFADVVAAVGSITGNRPTDRQLQVLEQQLNSQKVPYREALDAFEIFLRVPR
eukprot:TRINITY_DN47174_c0_g1_i1.p1 TRINITY_DN47174_c0_g1~~TRINITY_DN47174_c0_g1_i1.p1  ORF type:complete len:869 (-),score=153.44 TRINITY_DN47174_c0_g1_i1:205-2811(-)